MPELELARREGVELIRTGSWGALTGTWNPTRADILAAVESQQCPAVRRPRLKLGHTDPRFNADDEPAGDGEPALGWFENLRAADDGDTLIGDQVALPWLNAVQAAAYPDRSIEGNYRHRCALGHTHPFVVTAVALLGVTPPAVSTLRSVQDLPAMLGVAASSEVPDGAKHVQVTIMAGRHSFDESKHHRDSDGQFTSGGGTTAESRTPTSGLKRNESLAKRIPLADGETYVGSGTVRDGGFAVAAIDGPDGRTVRLGVGIDPDEAGTWSAANRGGTVVLDQERLDQTREAIAQLLDAAKAGKAKVRALYKEWDRLEAAETKLAGKTPRSDADDDKLAEIRAQREVNNAELEKLTDFGVLEEGVIHADWGDLHVQAYMSDDSPGFKVEVKASRQAPVRFDEILEVSHLRRLAVLLEKAGAATPVQASDPVQAAAGEHTSAVVMLVPAVEDAERLAIEKGEPAGELHVTLAYLGDAAALGAQGQQDVIDAVSTAANGLPEISADIFSVAAFNPPGSTVDDGRDRTACLVWGLSGDLIDAVHSLVSEALWAVAGPDQHRPWHCHMTAVLSDDLGRLGDLATRIGPVRFDRIRIAVAGQHTDIPLIPDGEQPTVAASARFEARLAELREQRAVHAAALAGLSPEPVQVPAPVLPAAEPEQPPTQTEEDLVSDTDLSGFRSRLGLTDDADQEQILSAIDALKAKADTPAQPTPEMVAASAAATEQAAKVEAEKNELAKEVQVLASQVKTMSDELAASKAEQAGVVKASVLDAAIKDGKIKPADRDQWAADYDEAPAAITRVLASIAVGTAVPVMASGHTGDPEPAGTSFDQAEYERLFGEKAGA